MPLGPRHGVKLPFCFEIAQASSQHADPEHTELGDSSCFARWLLVPAQASN